MAKVKGVKRGHYNFQPGSGFSVNTVYKNVYKNRIYAASFTPSDKYLLKQICFRNKITKCGLPTLHSHTCSPPREPKLGIGERYFHSGKL